MKMRGGGQRPFINFIKKQMFWYRRASLTNAVAYCAGVPVAAEIDMELKQVFTGELARGGNVPP